MIELRRRTKEAAKRQLWNLFVAGQRLGVDVLPRHFYSAIPDISALRLSRAWRQPRTLYGVAGTGIEEQLAFLALCAPAQVRARLEAHDLGAEGSAEQGADGYGPIECDVLYAFMATQRPAKVVQIGAGVSTSVLIRACQDFDFKSEIIAIDPDPTNGLRKFHDAGKIRLVAAPAQDVPLELLYDVGEGGFLFVDSTHTVGAESEVNRVIFEAMPRLPPGAFAHFHDIYFPYDYNRSYGFGDLFFSNESVLLHALLVGNSRLTIRVSLSMLHYAAPERVRALFSRYTPQGNDMGLRVGSGHFPSATYLQVVA